MKWGGVLFAEPVGRDRNHPSCIGGRRDHHWPAETPSLAELHSQAEECLQLRIGFDTLGDDAGVDVSSKREQRHHKGAAGGADIDAVDEQPVDLDELRLHLGDDQHAGVACSGIIDRNAKTALTQVRDHATEPVEVADRGSFAHLEDDVARRHAGTLGQPGQTVP